MTLKDFFERFPEAALAFSGGVDSAYLLAEGLKHARRLKAYYVKSEFQPAFELRDALRLAEELGADLEVIPLPALTKEVRENTEERCYYCKQNIFRAILARAEQDGFRVLLDGTNASDDPEGRPGMRALKELSVRSPLRECGLTKDEIRRRSKEAGLFTWDKPAYACLATRIPAGVPITEEVLAHVEASEEALFQMGFRDLRVRVFHDACRLELPEEDMAAAVEKRREIESALSPYFRYVLLDLKGR